MKTKTKPDDRRQTTENGVESKAKLPVRTARAAKRPTKAETMEALAREMFLEVYGPEIELDPLAHRYRAGWLRLAARVHKLGWGA